MNISRQGHEQLRVSLRLCKSLRDLLGLHQALAVGRLFAVCLQNEFLEYGDQCRRILRGNDLADHLGVPAGGAKLHFHDLGLIQIEIKVLRADHVVIISVSDRVFQHSGFLLSKVKSWGAARQTEYDSPVFIIQCIRQRSEAARSHQAEADEARFRCRRTESSPARPASWGRPWWSRWSEKR